VFIIALFMQDPIKQRIGEGTLTVLDVRPPEEFAAGHLPYAISAPVHDLESHLSQIPADREVVAYCRGPYCILSYEAVAKLREKGYSARRLLEGYPGWKQAGLPVNPLTEESRQENEAA
jgi:rhodanese-related sulfurtransferase